LETREIVPGLWESKEGEKKGQKKEKKNTKKSHLKYVFSGISYEMSSQMKKWPHSLKITTPGISPTIQRNVDNYLSQDPEATSIKNLLCHMSEEEKIWKTMCNWFSVIISDQTGEFFGVKILIPILMSLSRTRNEEIAKNILVKNGLILKSSNGPWQNYVFAGECQNVQDLRESTLSRRRFS
jgi:hypothetical protein